LLFRRHVHRLRHTPTKISSGAAQAAR
jgi:hypothetical protein